MKRQQEYDNKINSIQCLPKEIMIYLLSFLEGEIIDIKYLSKYFYNLMDDFHPLHNISNMIIGYQNNRKDRLKLYAYNFNYFKDLRNIYQTLSLLLIYEINFDILNIDKISKSGIEIQCIKGFLHDQSHYRKKNRLIVHIGLHDYFTSTEMKKIGGGSLCKDCSKTYIICITKDKKEFYTEEDGQKITQIILKIKELLRINNSYYYKYDLYFHELDYKTNLFDHIFLEIYFTYGNGITFRENK